MITDPLYRRIIERLEGQLDPSTFQDCANALLMDVFPTLAPMRGGDDEGMDGAIGHTQGDPSPIIVTTAPFRVRPCIVHQLLVSSSDPGGRHSSDSRTEYRPVVIRDP